MLFQVFFKCLLRNNCFDALRSLLSDPRYIKIGLTVLMYSLFG